VNEFCIGNDIVKSFRSTGLLSGNRNRYLRNLFKSTRDIDNHSYEQKVLTHCVKSLVTDLCVPRLKNKVSTVNRRAISVL
jgi:hypothetical protein